MKKKSERKSEKPHLIPQPNGRGALLSGGVPGNKGGTGRPPNRVRALMLKDLEETAPVLKQIAMDPAEKSSDRINAIATQARIGLPNQLEVGENHDSPVLTAEERKARLKALGLS